MRQPQTFRRGDTGICHRPDVDRYFPHDGQWYFTTREGVVMGPYDSRARAIAATGIYIAFVRSAHGPVLGVFRSRKATTYAG